MTVPEPAVPAVRHPRATTQPTRRPIAFSIDIRQQHKSGQYAREQLTLLPWIEPPGLGGHLRREE